MPDIFTYVLVGVVIYLCVFSIVERICRCCEQCAAYKAYGSYFASIGVTPDEIETKFSNISKSNFGNE